MKLEAAEGELLWTPSPEIRRTCRMSQYIAWLGRERGRDFGSYAALHAFSTAEPAEFWRTIWDYFEVLGQPPSGPVLSGALPNVRWFEGAALNYAEQALRRRDEHLAVLFRSESGEQRDLTYAELGREVARARAGLLRLGVERGDRVAGVVANRPEALVLFLATASLGAIWSSCSPEFGVGSVLDRFRQIEPKVLLVSDRYTYGGREFDRRADIAEIRSGLPGLRATLQLGEATDDPATLSWQQFLAEEGALEFERVPFDHPLWILFSSGTTGLPKAIVHGHGGMVLEHCKALALHLDLGETDRFFWYTTTGWMMWNFLVSGLLLGVSVVLYDGSPAQPDLDALWRLSERERVTYFGVSAPYLLACRKASVVPNERHDLSAMRAIGTTGAPLPADCFGWVYHSTHPELLLGSLSGGTDVCTAFVLPCPLLPVHAGEIQCAGLGASVEAFDDVGEPLIDRVGELVLTQPMPCMPVGFWNDPDDLRRLDSYFSTFPGVWRHGDWVKATPHGGFIIYGRSDSTLNRGGVRMGTSEFYRVVEALPEVQDSLVVDTGSLSERDGKLWLFVALRGGQVLDAPLRQRLRDVLRGQLSPRHVPDEIREVRAIPRTLNGKKLEVPVKRILLGAAPESAVSASTLPDPSVLEPFIALAAELRRSSGAPPA